MSGREESSQKLRRVSCKRHRGVTCANAGGVRCRLEGALTFDSLKPLVNRWKQFLPRGGRGEHCLVIFRGSGFQILTFYNISTFRSFSSSYRLSYATAALPDTILLMDLSPGFQTHFLRLVDTFGGTLNKTKDIHKRLNPLLPSLS